MVFSSLTFICLFLPLNLFAYYIPKNNSARNVIMLVFSLVFYAWGEPSYIFLLLFMTFSSWFYALLIEKHNNEGDKKKAKKYLILACVVSLGIIAIFKYSSFFLENIKYLTGFPKTIKTIALPIGVSFYTFQLLSYVVDVYRGDAKAQRNYANLLLYAGMYHQCVAGPIIRYSDIENELLNRKATVGDFNKGVMRFSSGLAKKVIFANSLGSIADSILLADADISNAAKLAENIKFIESGSALSLWFGVLVYALQIYLDFSAYSDMAIGMGLMTGFHYKENFDYPYASRSVTEFWRKWHISLGTFFRDYVYIPLGGNRRGKFRTVINLFIVWLLTGLWHGASWNFVLWGLYWFVFLSLEKLFLSELLKKLPSVFGHIYLLAVVYFGWILFKFKSLSLAAAVLKGMFCLNNNPFSTHEATSYILDNIIFVIFAIIASTPLVKAVKNKINELSPSYPAVNIIYSVFRAVIPAVLVIISAICLVGDSYNPFLYFNF